MVIKAIVLFTQDRVYHDKKRLTKTETQGSSKGRMIEEQAQEIRSAGESR